jgi:phospholipid transport system substrate-binding protein
MKLLVSLAAALLVLSAPSASLADGLAPDQLVRKLSEDVIDILRSDEALSNGDTTAAVRLIEEAVLPHFNLRRMTMLAVGRDWRETTPEQQQRLIDAFYGMLVRTYSNALTEYRDQTIEFRPLRVSPGETTVRVQTFIRQSGAQPVGVDYMLEQTSDGWKVFDIVVAGVSLVTNYRGTFAQEIRAGGIDGLIRSLEARGSDSNLSGQS